jgi:hypothetical protein
MIVVLLIYRVYTDDLNWIVAALIAAESFVKSQDIKYGISAFKEHQSAIGVRIIRLTENTL